jgi:hypothetical protein
MVGEGTRKGWTRNSARKNESLPQNGDRAKPVIDAHPAAFLSKS